MAMWIRRWRRPSARRLPTLWLVLLVALAIGGPAAYAPTPAAALSDAEPAAIPERYLTQTIAWSPCDFDGLLRDFYPSAPHTLCASVTVPMDWRHPDAHPDITLAVAHSAATGVSKGLLLSNPGGPGADALDWTSFLAADRTRMFRDFDLLGFDPRGFGQSSSVRCATTVDEFDRLPSVDDARVRSRKAHSAELAAAKLYAQACTGSELSQFIGTQQVVYDVEFLRQLIGQQREAFAKLHYIGYSYGTWLGAWYADTYPDQVGRFILDSNMNWTSTMEANEAGDPRSFQRRRDQMFYPWVARHDRTYRLGKTSAAVKRSYERIRVNVAKAYSRGEAIYSASEGDDIIASQLYANADFRDAVGTILQLKAVGTGRGRVAAQRSMADQADRYLGRRAGSPGDLRQARAMAARASSADDEIELGGADQLVRCLDTTYSRDVTRQLRRADTYATRYPFIGYGNTVTMCSYVRYPAASRTVDLSGAPMMLMLQSEGDPATAYEGARAAHRATPDHTRLVSVDNEGQHSLFIGGPSKCAEKIGDSFLFSGTVPPADVVCTTKPLPGDKKVYALNGPVTAAKAKAASTEAAPAPANARVREIRAAVARASR